MLCEECQAKQSRINRPKRSCALLMPLFLILLWTSLLGLGLGCEFPSNVQTNGSMRHTGVARDWRGMIKEQYGEFTLHIEITRKEFRTVATDASAKSHTRACVRAIPGGKYLVAHEESGQQGNRFTCLQFVHRSQDVIQVRSAPVGDKLDLALCNDDRLALDKWLIVDRAHVGRNPLECPLQGGFILSMFDKIRSQGVCDAWRGEVRLESECVPGDGLTFYFRTQKCVPEDLMMFSTQPMLCLANWHDGAYVYTLLRHNELPHFWVLRLPAMAIKTSDSFTAYLFKDLLAESTEYSNTTHNYIRMDMTRDVTRDVTQLCFDDYEICSEAKIPCTGRTANLALICPVSCGICTPQSFSSCNLPSDWSGQWADRGGGTSGRGGRARALSINSTSMAIQGGVSDVQASCVRWSSARDETDRMLVRTFPRGCRPRYTCVKQLKRTSSFLYLKQSRPVMWPLTKAANDPIDCASFTYDVPHHGNPANLDLSVTANAVLLLFNPASPRRPVECLVPATNYVNYGVVFREGHRNGNGNGNGNGVAECNASLMTSRTQTSVELTTVDCATNQLTNVSYECIDSSNITSGARLIMAETVRQGSAGQSSVFCWLFLPMTSQGTVFYLMNISQCHQVTRPDARLDRLHHYIAKFSSRHLRHTTSPKVSPITDIGDQGGETENSTPGTLPPGVDRSSGELTTSIRTLTVNESGEATPTEEAETVSRNPFVVSAAAFILAILQALFMCGCL